MLKRLIVNADDLGLSAGANEAIFDAFTRGAVNSASLMANMPGFDDAATLARSYPALDIGVHVTLAAGRPLSPPGEIPSLVDGSGRFFRRKLLLLNLIAGKVRSADVRREVHAQVQKVVDAGIRPSHIDGDQHVHVLPGVRGVVLRVAQDLRIAVRVPNERIVLRGWKEAMGIPGQTPTLLRKVALRALARAFRRKVVDFKIPANDHFISMFGVFPRRSPSATDLVALVGHLENGVTELMVHPARGDAETATFWGSHRASREREREMEALSSDLFAQAVRSSGATLTTYRALGSAA